MKVKWYGHSAFKLEVQGLRIIIDPYESGAYGGLSYGKIEDEADIVLTSHDHADHGYTKDIKGKFEVIKKEGERQIKGVNIKAIPSYHDSKKGKERGNNLIFVIEAEGLRIAHMGDLGHVLDEELAKKIGTVDVLFIPVGGFYTIDAKEADKVVEQIDPKIVIPMHYKTEKCNFPISSVDEFLKGKDYERLEVSEWEVKKENLPQKRKIVVLKHAL